MSKLKKALCFTDIHFGAKSNLQEHNENCFNFVQWALHEARQLGDIDHIVIAGDWHEHRSSVHGITLKYSVDAMRLLNDFGVPVYFLLGNHDLVQRQTRNYYTTYFAHCFSNFEVITEPTIIDTIHGTSLMCPFMFEDEYKDLVKYLSVPVWWGHFEFKGFVLTGHNTRMEHGPDGKDFEGPIRIFSGHYHKRQSIGNIYYVGNVFPTNYSDVGDKARGFTVYDYETDEVSHMAWPNAPVFVKARLTDLLDGAVELPPRASVRCIIDMPITYEESIALKQDLITQHNLREFVMEESDDLDAALTETDVDLDGKLKGTSELVMDMLQQIDTPKIDKDKLMSIYQKLQSSQNG